MQDYSWSVWQTGTYSLNWNSTQWTLWPSNSEWLGGVQISLNSGYWRISTNETYIIEWLYSGAWNGGYFPNNEYPVAWAAGYTGILWNECQTLENTKYQKISNYQWQEWPNPVYNSIKVIGVILLVFIFLMVIIIINIRKSRESEMSVLMRILTNYVQLITASISGNIKFPDTITSIFIPAEQVGGSSDTFLSFDWFFSYTEILKIFDSTSIFKLFLTGILPIFLTIFAFATLMAIYLFNKRLFPSIKRNAIISFISILLLLHPKLASSSLSIFQWVQIDSHQERVRINTSIEWYSGEHLKWCFLIGFPILAIWVTIIPLAGLFLLFRNIHKGEQNAVNQYFLILHQGLKKQRYYWEFVNSIRKVLILIIFALLVTYSTFYRILSATIVLVISIRLQVYLQPYK